MMEPVIGVLWGVVLMVGLAAFTVWAGETGIENHERRMYRDIAAGQADDVRGWVDSTGAAWVEGELQPIYATVESE